MGIAAFSASSVQCQDTQKLHQRHNGPISHAPNLSSKLQVCRTGLLEAVVLTHIRTREFVPFCYGRIFLFSAHGRCASFVMLRRVYGLNIVCSVASLATPATRLLLGVQCSATNSMHTIVWCFFLMVARLLSSLRCQRFLYHRHIYRVNYVKAW